MANASFIQFGSPEVARVEKDPGADLVEGNPVQGVWLYSDDTKTGSRFGVWECAAGKFNASYAGITEFCHILKGEAHVTNRADGTINTVKAGDSFVIESGFEAQWHVPTYIKKSFAISDVKD